MPANGGLLELSPDDYQDIDPSIFATQTESVAAPDGKTGLMRYADDTPRGDGAAPAADAASPAPADGGTKPADEGPGFFERLQRGIGKVGWVLGGGDPGLANLSPEQQQTAGARALLNMGLSMLSR